MKTEDIVKKLAESFHEKWEEEIANEVALARNTIVTSLKELGTSLPGAVFALDLVKMELVRAQLEEFMGNVNLSKVAGSKVALPLSSKKPEPVKA